MIADIQNLTGLIHLDGAKMIRIKEEKNKFYLAQMETYDRAIALVEASEEERLSFLRQRQPYGEARHRDQQGAYRELFALQRAAPEADVDRVDYWII